MFNFRFIEVKGKKYVRVEDMVEYIREMGGGEETDVRSRFNDAADGILAQFLPCGRMADIQKNGTFTKPFPICTNSMCEACNGIKTRRKP